MLILRGGSGTTYTGLNQIVVDSDANTIANAIWIASEAEIDANALAVVNALDLNTSLGYSSYNCDNNSSCTITGSINSTTGEFVNLTVTGTTTTETDLSVFDDFNAGITGSYPLIYKKAGSFLCLVQLLVVLLVWGLGTFNSRWALCNRNWF